MFFSYPPACDAWLEVMLLQFWWSFGILINQNGATMQPRQLNDVSMF